MLPRPVAIVFLAMLLQLAGCGQQLMVTRTVSLPGLAALSDATRVTVTEDLRSVTKPYQIVGKISVYRAGTVVFKNTAIERISHYAAEMGADGVIGFRANYPKFGAGLYSGIAVKWLAPGEEKKPLKVPFKVALLTPKTSLPAPNKTDPDIYLISYLDSRGYYLLPGSVYAPHGIMTTKTIDDVQLRNLGGADSDFLLEFDAFTLSPQEAFERMSDGIKSVVGAVADVDIKLPSSVIRITLMNKHSREIIYTRQALSRDDLLDDLRDVETGIKFIGSNTEVD